MQLTAVEDIERSSAEERDSHYKPGSIKRVKLKNFLTVSYVGKGAFVIFWCTTVVVQV